MRLVLDPSVAAAYQEVPLAVAEWADAVFDWLEADPVNPHARRHRFTNGMYAVLTRALDRDWVLLWEPAEDEARVRYLGDAALL